ncbi:MAG: Sapep family Mn(2+)-dependent dipeptidase [Treponema sp.]|jgi:succinyl-diaminopimelate desuccinylase|nr:Sapep family Mn(2+)-dependent dipeptidase [Treponema sp.]
MTEKEVLARLETWIPAHRDELVRDLIELVNIRSVCEKDGDGKPFGPGPAAAIDKGLEYGEKYGFTTDNDAYYNLSFLLPGTDPKREIGLVNHVDVVPEGSGWTYEPYNAIEKEGHVIGRGSSDNKGPALLSLYVLRALRDLGVSLRHTVRVIWGGNEEGGDMADVAHFAETHEVPELSLVLDAAFPVCYGEKGIIEGELSLALDEPAAGSLGIVDFSGGLASNMVPDSAFILTDGGIDRVKKALAGADVAVSEEGGHIKIAAAGAAGHAAFPEHSVSAIQKLAATLAGSGLFSGSAQKFLAFIAAAFADYRGAGLGIAETDDTGSFTTHIGGYIRLQDGVLKQNINIRYALRGRGESVIARVAETADKAGLSFRVIKHSGPRYDDPESPVIRLLTDTANELLHLDAKPYAMGGGTHARKLKNALPYGPGYPMAGPPDGEKPKFGGPHGKDESVEIKRLLAALPVYVIALIRLDGLLR